MTFILTRRGRSGSPAGVFTRRAWRRGIAGLGVFAFLLPLLIQTLSLEHCSIDDQLRLARGIPSNHHAAAATNVAAPAAELAGERVPHQHGGPADQESLACMVWLALQSASIFLAPVLAFFLPALLGLLWLGGGSYRAPTLSWAFSPSHPRAPPLAL